VANTNHPRRGRSGGGKPLWRAIRKSA
jgi:hypothetical protein